MRQKQGERESKRAALLLTAKNYVLWCRILPFIRTLLSWQTLRTPYVRHSCFHWDLSIKHHKEEYSGKKCKARPPQTFDQRRKIQIFPEPSKALYCIVQRADGQVLDALCCVFCANSQVFEVLCVLCRDSSGRASTRGDRAVLCDFVLDSHGADALGGSRSITHSDWCVV